MNTTNVVTIVVALASALSGIAVALCAWLLLQVVDIKEALADFKARHENLPCEKDKPCLMVELKGKQ